MKEIDFHRLDLNLLVTFEVLMTEGSVTRAAARLKRTQSAVSHSLARLREQLGDPLLVKMGSGMAPSPFAQRLIEDVRPILRSIRRCVAPPEPFDPATRTWGTAAWVRWPHIQVQLGERSRGAVDVAAAELGLERTIGASVPNFSQVPALLARTNLLATMTPLVMDGAMEPYGLCALEPPIAIKPVSFSFVWSFRLANGPGSRWMRTLMMNAYAQLHRSVTLMTSGRRLVKVRSRSAAG